MRLLIKGFEAISLALIKGVSADMEAKYPGGHWVTERGRHVYIRKDGTPAPETAPTKAKPGAQKAPAKSTTKAKAEAKSTKAKAETAPTKTKPSAQKATSKTAERLQRLAVRRGEPELAPDPKAAKKAIAAEKKTRATKVKAETKPGAQKAPAKATTKGKTALVVTPEKAKLVKDKATMSLRKRIANYETLYAGHIKLPKEPPTTDRDASMAHYELMQDVIAWLPPKQRKLVNYLQRRGLPNLIGPYLTGGRKAIEATIHKINQGWRGADDAALLTNLLYEADSETPPAPKKAPTKAATKPPTAYVKSNPLQERIEKAFDDTLATMNVENLTNMEVARFKAATDVMEGGVDLYKKLMAISAGFAPDLKEQGAKLDVVAKKKLDTHEHRAERATRLAHQMLLGRLTNLSYSIDALQTMVTHTDKPDVRDFPMLQDTFGHFEAIRQLIRVAAVRRPKSVEDAVEMLAGDRAASRAIGKYGPPLSFYKDEFVKRMAVQAYLTYEFGIRSVDGRGKWTGRRGNVVSADPYKYPSDNAPTGLPKGMWSPPTKVLVTAAHGLERLPSWMRLGGTLDLVYDDPKNPTRKEANAYYSPGREEMVFPLGVRNGMDSSVMENVYTHEYMHHTQYAWLMREYKEFNRKAGELAQSGTPLTAHQMAQNAVWRERGLGPDYGEEWAISIESMTNPFSHALINSHRAGTAVDCPHPDMWNAASEVLGGEFGRWRFGEPEEIMDYWGPRRKTMEAIPEMPASIKDLARKGGYARRIPVPDNTKTRKKAV